MTDQAKPSFFAPGVWFAVGAAMLFGLSTPLSKLILGHGLSPFLMAGLLYLGSGLGLMILRLVLRSLATGQNEAPLGSRDWPWMGLVVLSGGVAGPILLMLGLTHTAASSAALLLNLEGLATMAIAWIVFRENVDRRLLLGAAAILAGAVILSWSGGISGVGIGSLAIAGACLAWGIDNNLTRKLSGSDPLQIAMVKGLAVGVVNLTLAFTLGARVPSLPDGLSAAAMGSLAMG